VGYKVIVRQYPKFGRHGDRATVDRPYTAYKVCIQESHDPRAEVVAQEWTGYDSFSSAIKNPAGVLNEVTVYATGLAAFFDDSPRWVTMRQKPVVPQPIEWEEVEP
jgi:hypothetical protein